jgi:FKBP-type peptidyl-prolyl cis-trans isomerase FklB
LTDFPIGFNAKDDSVCHKPVRRTERFFVREYPVPRQKKEVKMKYLLTIFLSIVFSFSICSGDEKVELKSEKDKLSYSLGYQFGQSLKAQKLDVNVDFYISGVKDFLGGKEPMMTQEEIRVTISELQKRLMAARQKELKEKGEINLAESKAFLEENKKKEGIKVLDSGLQYKVLTEGSGRTPKAEDKVSVQYRGTLIDGTEIDSSYKRGQPAIFQVGSLIRGWSEALQLMKEGAKWQIFIPPDLAYGENGAGNVVQPNSILIFEVELISIN